MEYVLFLIIFGLLFARASDKMNPGRSIWILGSMVILWPLYLLILALWGKSNEEANP